MQTIRGTIRTTPQKITGQVKETAAGGYAAGYTAGQQDEYNRFWDGNQHNGAPKSYFASYAGNGWTDETFDPKHKIVIDGDASYIFSYSQMTKPLTKDMIDFSGANNLTNAFNSSNFEEIELIDSSANVNVYSYTFNRAACKKIGLLILSEVATAKVNSTTFQRMSNLVYIRIQGTFTNSFNIGSSPLDKDTITHLFSVMSDETSGFSATFSKNAVNTAFETAEGAADGSTSEEWLALVASKSNWSIVLA